MYTTHGHMPSCNKWQRCQVLMQFFEVPGNRPALVGMPDCEWLQPITVTNHIAVNQHKECQINDQTKQD